MGLWPTGGDENPGAPFLARSLREKWGFSTERSRRVRPAKRAPNDSEPPTTWFLPDLPPFSGYAVPPRLEYHVFVRHSIPASVALFSLLALPLLLSTSHAQVNGTPTGVTSHGFGGSHPITAPFPSGGTLPGHQVPSTVSHSTFSTSAHSGDGHSHRHHYVQYTPPVIYAVPVPYAIDIGATDDDSDPSADDSDANYQGGPTIFDRRGSGADSYIPPERDAPMPSFYQRTEANPPAPEPPPEPTLLVFKDGSKLEVGNYAIVGTTLFDLTPGHSRKVALADLDLPATQKQNDDRGVNFQIPQLPQAD
jgi:hypothetical protein